MMIWSPIVMGTCFGDRPHQFGTRRWVTTAGWSYLTLGIRLMRRADID